MIKEIMTDKKFSKLMSYYLEERHYGKLKYFWEIYVPAKEKNNFIAWLNECELLGLIYAFAVVELCEGCTFFYGFTNFEVPERKGIRCLQLNFSNDDILYQHFLKWTDESECFISATLLKADLKLNEKLSGQLAESKLTNEIPT